MAITSANQLELLQTAEAVAREKMIDPALVIEAMEESLARASALYPTLNACWDYYEINRREYSLLYTDHMIYSPRVPIFKDEEGVYLEDWVAASILRLQRSTRGWSGARRRTRRRKSSG